ncbi:barstar family protein [Aliiroseovarius sp.]|uniref:barstar family protein n=1 Tax=Aliiroseovarius sp. TaxID=1872442 RepID=UPI00260B6B06|nr:barstar family protein [Aliiroseovarius sp.]
MTRYEIDGARFADFDGFCDEISRQLIPDTYWGRNLNAFNDILRGGFGTPEEGFHLVWRNADLSRDSLGRAETLRVLRAQLKAATPEQRPLVLEDIEDVLRGSGDTLFDWLVMILQEHGPGGSESEDNVTLTLLGTGGTEMKP